MPFGLFLPGYGWLEAGGTYCFVPKAQVAQMPSHVDCVLAGCLKRQLMQESQALLYVRRRVAACFRALAVECDR